MHVSIFLALASASAATARNVLQLDISKPKQTFSDRQKLRIARRSTVTEPLLNAGYLYVANVSVGTPPQSLQMQLDTGSSDVWMTASDASFCQQSAEGCRGGTFDYEASSTFKIVDQGGFDIQYVDNTGSSGDFFTDVLQIGPDNGQVSIDNQQMGLALDTTIGTGIIGVGFAADESVCNQSPPGRCNTYPTLVQNLVSQKKINSQAYSLWLNDLDANTGSILFGGIDTEKFMGELVTLPIQPDEQSKAITSFTVAWTGLTLGTPKGSVGGFVPDNFATAAILDSGTTLTLVPDEIATAIYKQFDATFVQEYGLYLAPCSLRTSTATFDFEFGGSQGVVIRVPIDELLLDTVPDEYGEPVTFADGSEACEIGIEAAQDRPILFGDTFLRSAYVVYDLDNLQVSLAQTDFNSTQSNVEEIKAGKNGLPDTSSTATAASVRQTATGLPGMIGGLDNIPRSSATSTLTSDGSSSSTGSSSSVTDSSTGSMTPSDESSLAPLAQYTDPNPNSPQPSGPQSAPGTSTAAAARATVRGSIFLTADGMWMAAAVTCFVVLGSGLVLF